MKVLRLSVASIIAGVSVCWLAFTIQFELAYRHVLSGFGPLPTFQRLEPLPEKVATALWVASARCRPGQVRPIYWWNIHTLFDDDDQSHALACQVARPMAHGVHEASKSRGEGHWHLRFFVAAVWISRNLSTDQILAHNARDVWMGKHGQGLANAGRQLFRKELAALDYSEIALLLAVSGDPSRYDPHRNPRQAQERRNRILQRLCDAGVLSAKETLAAQSLPMRVQKTSS